MAGNDAQNWAFFAAIRVSNVTSPGDDILPMIFPDFQENPGQPMGLQNGPFLSANHGWGLPQLWVKLRASGGGLEMMPKMGHP